MACSLKNGLSLYGFDYVTLSKSEITKRVSGFCSSQQLGVSNSETCHSLSSGFLGQELKLRNCSFNRKLKSTNNFSVNAQASICVSRAMKWWEKTIKPNMVEIHSGKQLVEFLVNAGDRLVIVDFYSPGCGGCRTLHPKICQLADENPNAIFVKVNYEELKTLCNGLKVHVLPFFRFYRGSEGRLCSFSCTNATIKKFKDALAKHGTDRCSLGPAKGLSENELSELASLGEIEMQLSSTLQFPSEEIIGDLFIQGMDLSCFTKEQIFMSNLLTN